MKGDFTRDSFESHKRFTRVLQQQGRVQIDADWNEQVAIFWEYWRNFTRDLVGPFAGPHGKCGFGIIPSSEIDGLVSPSEASRLKDMLKSDDDFLIGPGSYYVDGLLCRNTDYVPYSHQPDLRQHGLRSSSKGKFLIYLDVWERHINWAEDSSIREVALGGADTCSRAKLVWQVKHHELTDTKTQDAKSVKDHWEEIVQQLQPSDRGFMRARAKEPSDPDLEPCTVSPQARYRGPENQLYRVEIHRGGHVAAGNKDDGPTFKWSRENGSVIFPIVEPLGGNTVTLEGLGRDSRSGLEVGDWVEFVDDEYVLQNKVEPLLRIDKIPDNFHVVLSGAPKPGKDSRHPYLRRWDQKEQKLVDARRTIPELQDGAVVLREGDMDRGAWITLEDGIQIQFTSADPSNHYRTGDYWLIPARTATGDVVWPHVDGKPLALPPRGIRHHYAPLAILDFEGGELALHGHLRTSFKTDLALISDSGFGGNGT